MFCGSASAQATGEAPRAEPNDAQQLQRQQERENALRRSVERPVEQAPTVEPPAPWPRLPANEVSCFVIERLALKELVFERGDSGVRGAKAEAEAKTGNRLGAEPAVEVEAAREAKADAEPEPRAGAGARPRADRRDDRDPPLAEEAPTQRPTDRFAFLLDAAAGPDGDDSPIGRCLGTDGIEVLNQRLQRAAIDSGHVTTRVVVGAQDLADSSLTFVVVPGLVHAIRFSEDSSDRGTAWNAVPAAPGDLLRLRDIEQGLDNLKRVPTAEADIQIVPVEGEGAAPGASDLVVHYRQNFPIRLSMSVDDGGTESTGKVQGTATVSYDNALTLNDLFYVSVGHDLGDGGGGAHDGKGTRNATVHYSIPFGWWLFSATASSNRYHQSVAGVNQTYVYAGRSETEELRASRVVWRDARGKTTLGLRGFRRASSNFIDDTEIEVQRRITAGYELSAAHRQFVGEAVFDASLALRRGTGAFGSIAAPEEAFGEGTSRMEVATLDLGVSRPIDIAGTRLRLASNWHGQWNRTPLSPQDRTAIGGRYSVRGFDGESSLMAERGWFWRNELGLSVGLGQEAYLGVDAGRVGGASAPSLLGRSLAGAVVGLRGVWQSLSFDVFAGMPLHKPDGFRTAGTTVGFNASHSW